MLWTSKSNTDHIHNPMLKIILSKSVQDTLHLVICNYLKATKTTILTIKLLVLFITMPSDPS